MTTPDPTCRTCGHCLHESEIEGSCWVGSEDSGPDTVLLGELCADWDHRPFRFLHPGVKVRRWEQI